uniref:Aldehyde dehydrogenase domain-containing protein n=1 Tax=Aegilops tauschii subsp. strangulata TaxID=200361 RepID=A0A453CK11_AEGTS
MGAPVAINGPIGERAITCSHSQWSTGAAEQSERVRAESMGSMVASVEEIGAAAAPQAVERRLGELRATFESGRTRPLSWRQSQLRGLLRLLADKEEEAFRALHDDLGKHRAEAYRDEVGVLTKSANAALREIGKWAAPEKGLGAAGGVPGERAGGAGAARGRPHLLLLELPLGSVSGAADRGHSGGERGGAEAVGAGAGHGQVPGGEHRRVPGRHGGEGHPGRPRGGGAAHGAQMGQGPLHRVPARGARGDGGGGEAPDARGAGAGREVPLHLRRRCRQEEPPDLGEPRDLRQVVVLRRPGLHRHRLRARRGAVCAHPDQVAQVDAEEVHRRLGPDGADRQRAAFPASE